MTSTLTVQSGPVCLAVQTRGDAGRPSVVLVHGYPDTHLVWDRVAERLERDFHVVTYDVRGAGASDAPKRTSDYALTHLLGDLEAVLDAACPGKTVHLVGHDWGSIQGWEAVLTPTLAARLASYTSMSGPVLDHASEWMRQRLPSGPGARDALRQLSRSWYVAFFHLPVLPELAWRLGAAKRFPQLLRAEGITDGPLSPTLADDGRRGIELYRANFLKPLRRPERRRTQVPVQLLVALRDPYVTPPLTEGLEVYAEDLTRVEVPSGHWMPLSHPEVVADAVSAFARGHTAGKPGKKARA